MAINPEFLLLTIQHNTEFLRDMGFQELQGNTTGSLSGLLYLTPV